MDGWTPAYLYNVPVSSRVYVPFSFVIDSDQIVYSAVNQQLITKTSEEKATGLKLLLGGIIISPLVYRTGVFIKELIKQK